MAIQILFGVILPFIVGVLLVYPGAARPWRVTAAVALPVVVAFLVVNGGWPGDKWQDLMWLPVAGLLIAVIPRAGPLRSVLVAGVGTWIVWPIVRSDPILVRVLPGLGALGLMLSLEPLAKRRPGPSMPIAVGLAFGGAAAVILISGHLNLAVSVAAAGFALAGVGAASIARRDISMANGPLLAALPLLAVAMVVRYSYMIVETSEVPTVALLLPPLAPLLRWVGEVPPLTRMKGRKAGVLRVAAVLAVSVVAVGLAIGVAQDEEGVDPDEQMYREMMSFRLSSAE